jgi:Flp pilus assembly protein TadD
MSGARALRRAAALAMVAALVALGGCSHIVVLHDPLGASEHNDLGVTYEAHGERELAASEYRKALRLDPRFAAARVNLGNVEAASGRWRRAESCYRRALADSATDWDAMNNLAIALLRQGRSLEEARGLAERAVASGSPRDSIYRATLQEVRAGAR